MIRSTVSEKSTPGLRSISALIGSAARSSPRTVLREPLTARPIGVRMASTMTTSGITDVLRCLDLAFRRSHSTEHDFPGGLTPRGLPRNIGLFWRVCAFLQRAIAHATIWLRYAELMQVLALYDIHGNVDALEAVLADPRVAGADAIVIAGDALPGPFPRETLARLDALAGPVHWIRGNGERELAEVIGVEVDPENLMLATAALNTPGI